MANILIFSFFFLHFYNVFYVVCTELGNFGVVGCDKLQTPKNGQKIIFLTELKHLLDFIFYFCQ